MNDQQFQQFMALFQDFRTESQDQFQAFKNESQQQFQDFKNEIYPKFESIDKRFDVIDERFDVIDTKFQAIDERFIHVDHRFNHLDKKIEDNNKKFEYLYEDIKSKQKEDHALLMDIWKSRDKVTAEVTWKFISQAGALNMTLLFIMWGFMNNFS
jgi:chromosome segregation ATPase